MYLMQVKQNQAAPAISLLVPICNVEKYLRECLDSAMNQTLKNIEVICINDGSTDSSPDIIREYMAMDSRFKMIDKPNSGYGDSMNMGLSQCKGEYVGILESDDFLDFDALQFMYDAAKRVDAQVVKTDFYLYWSHPTPRNIRFCWVDEILEGHINPQIEREVFYLKPSIWSAIYKREFLEENDIAFLPTPGASYQDAGFNFKVWASCDNAVLLNKAFLHYRQDNEKSSVNSPGKVFCVCDEYAEMHRYLDTHWPERGQYLRPILARMRFDTYEWNYERLADELKGDFLPRMRQDVIDDEVAGFTDANIFDSIKRQNRALLVVNSELYVIKKATDGVLSRKERLVLLLKRGGLVKTVRLLLFRLFY